MAERILIIPDTHFPDYDKRLWKSVLEVVGALEPDEIIHIGDLMDLPQPSRWTKGTRAEFEGSVYQDAANTVKFILEPLRGVYSGPIRIHEGNHDARPRIYMEKYAPALAETEMFNFEKLLGFDELGIDRLPDFYPVAPGWLTTHGHLGGIRLNQNAGQTALNAAKRIGKSIVMGHTHRAGISSFTTGLHGLTDTLTGVEVGHIMDPKKVTYLKGATGNWQQGLALLTIDGKHTTPTLIPVSEGKMTIDGKVYKV
jgi:predicted phosphodiesterase